MLTKNDGGTLMARMKQSPLLLQPESEDLFMHSINEMLAHESYADAMETSDTMLADDFWDDEDDFISWLRPYNVRDGALVIPVKGVLMNKLSIKFGSWATGYQYIERAFERGLEDPEVTAIIFDIDSPGGEVAGNFELAEKIASHRGEKPMRAVANDYAFSAAYSLATAADSITMARSGGVGSVGVVTMHMDMSERMEKMGVKVTFIHAGKHKVDGNPYEALPDAVKGRIQERIDRIYGEFVSLVADNRGMEEQAVRDTEALTYDVSNAVDIGFADRIGTMDEELVELTTSTEMEQTMATQTPKKTNATTATEGGITQEQMDAAVASARTEGATAERERTSAIMDSEEAKDRPAAARALADTGMDADAAITALGKMPKETAAAPAPEGDDDQGTQQPQGHTPAPTPFADHMDGPGVGAEVQGGKGNDKDQAVSSDDLLGSYAAATGRDMRKKAS
jgi:signal peptide peptidase SppA